MKRLIYIVAALFIAAIPFDSFAVTDKEMEQARVIAAQTYLRWANDGSGYLDAMHPTTMAALEKGLKPKEKENLKAFKAIAVPKNYASWDKGKLVEYWSTTAFASPGLSDSGRRGKDRVRRKLNAMTVSAPAPEKKETPKPATAAADTKTAAPAESKAAAPQAQTPATPAVQEAATATETTDSAQSALKAAETLAADALVAEEDDITIQKAENHTWIYIVILCILVAIVVALVVFASNVMKRNAAAKEAEPAKPEPQALTPDPRTAPSQPKELTEEANRMREKFAATLTAKNGEIHILNKKLEEALRQNSVLKNNLESLTNEVNSLRNRLSAIQAAQAQPAPQAVPVQAPQPVQAAPAPAVQPQPVERTVIQPAPQPVSQPAPQPVAQPAVSDTPHVRSIYLGRANAKGIFVRADRTLNLGNSIYRLDTTDGYSGSFRVANDPTVWQMALLTPRESLGGACVTADLDNTEGMQRIVNDASGTAIFEGGCWKVIRKAKIHYE